jgi:hypothetical protein
MLSYSRHTTNFFEATTATEAGLLALVTGWVLKPEKEDPVGLASDGGLVTGRLAGLRLQNKVAKTGGLFQ